MYNVMRFDKLNYIFCNFIVFKIIKIEILYIGFLFCLNFVCKLLVKVLFKLCIFLKFVIVLYVGIWVIERFFRLFFCIIFLNI